MIKVDSRVNYHPFGIEDPTCVIKGALVYSIDHRRIDQEVELVGWPDRYFPLRFLKRNINY